MKSLPVAALSALILAACASHYPSSTTTVLQSRGDTLWTLVDSEWSHIGDRINDGEDIPPSRVYPLAQIHYTLRGGQTLPCMADLDAQSRTAARDMIDWSEKAMTAYMDGKPYPAFAQQAKR